VIGRARETATGKTVGHVSLAFRPDALAVEERAVFTWR
jgi:hypothetical protein